MKEISKTGKTLLSLLNNVGDLVVISNDRRSAVDVMKALQIYASSNNYSLPPAKIDDFFVRVYDARPYDIRNITLEIGNHILNNEMKNKSNKAKK